MSTWENKPAVTPERAAHLVGLSLNEIRVLILAERLDVRMDRKRLMVTIASLREFTRSLSPATSETVEAR